MKILKLIKDDYSSYKAVFDRFPKLTYEKVGVDYIGSAVNSNGDIVASHWLEKRGYGDAFAGREIRLKMKDGSEKTIKDYWFDSGSYPEHGEFMSIGAGTLDKLQECYVYSGYYINVDTFQKMVDEYLSFDKIYGYWEVEEWCKLQYKWYDVIVNGKKIPYMMNFRGQMVDKETKKRVSPRENRLRKINGDFRTHVYFRFKYKQDGKLIKIDANYLDTLKDTLPYREDEIRKNCGLPSIEDEEKTKRKFKALKLINELSLSDKQTVFCRLKEDLEMSKDA